MLKARRDMATGLWGFCDCKPRSHCDMSWEDCRVSAVVKRYGLTKSAHHSAHESCSQSYWLVGPFNVVVPRLIDSDKPLSRKIFIEVAKSIPSKGIHDHHFFGGIRRQLTFYSIRKISYLL